MDKEHMQNINSLIKDCNERVFNLNILKKCFFIEVNIEKQIEYFENYINMAEEIKNKLELHK
jgi:hypothetical protein